MATAIDYGYGINGNGRPLSFDDYKAVLKAGQKYVAKMQAADPEWQAYNGGMMSGGGGADFADAASQYNSTLAVPSRDYWTEFMGTLRPEVASDFQRHMGDSKDWGDVVGSVLKVVIPALVTGGALAATGAFGAAAQSFVGGASLGSTALAEAGVTAAAATTGVETASTLPVLWDTGVGGYFGSEAAIAAASDVAFGVEGLSAGTVLSSFGATSILPAGLGFGEGMTLSTLAASSGLSLADAAAKVADAAKASAPVAKTLLDSIGGVGGLVNAGLGVAAAVTAAQAAKDQAEEDQRTAEYNAQEAEYAARNALQRGEEEARDLRRSGSLLQGAQRSSYAGRGVSLNEGTPAAAVNQTDFFTDQDMSTARSNAATEAATYRRQGARFNAQAGYINPSRTGGLALVGGLATVASRWYDRYGN